MVDRNRAEGVLLGLACGDALGRPVEFHTPRQIADRHSRVTDMLGHGTHNQPAGTITDDTEMALCLARSLAERGTFDPDDVARRFVAWYESDPFDIGIMTSKTLRRIGRGESWRDAGQAVWEASPEGSNAGNGSVMRCAPLAIAYATDRSALIETSRDSSKITHADPRCTWGCAVLNLVIAGYLRGEADPLDRALSRLHSEMPDELRNTLEGIPAAVDPSDLSNSGYVVHTLQTALYDALAAETAEDAIVTAVNRGGDADTIAAVAGAVAGARFGGDALPQRWLDAIDETDELRGLARELAAED